MTKFILKLFVKNCDNTQDADARLNVGKAAGKIGIVCNCLLALGKLITGIVIGSVAIIADAVNNLSDAASSVITLLGFRLAQRPADKDHPYGHARYEYLSGLAIAAMILLIGVELVKSSVRRVISPMPADVSVAALILLAVFAAVKLWMNIFYKKLGREIGSTTLIAAAVDSRNDVIATCGVLAGCAVSFFFNLDVDGYIGAVVAAFIIWSGIQIGKDTLSPLLGRGAEKELVDELNQIILSNEKVLGIHDLLVHDYGPGKCYASVHVELSAAENSLVCHDIIDEIEWEVQEKLNVNLVIHYDPVVSDDAEQNRMREKIDKIVKEIDPAFTVHDFRIARGTRQPKLVFDLSIPYRDAHRHGEIKVEIDEKLAQCGCEYVTVIRFDGIA